MKKMLKCLAGFALVVALVIGVVGTVFANQSKSGDVTVDADTNIEIDKEQSEQKGQDGGWTALTAEKAAELIGEGITADKLQVVWQMVVNSDELPTNLTFTYDGYKSGQVLYLFHNSWKELGDENDVWQLVSAAGANSVSWTTTELSPMALVVYTPSGASDDTSPKTGETNALLFLALAAIALGSVTAAVVAKKKA